jgi:hypothetical protein
MIARDYLMVRPKTRITQYRPYQYLREGFWVGMLIFCGLIQPVNDSFGQGNLKPTIQISANVYEYRLDGEKQLGLFYQYNRKSGSVQNSDVFLPGTNNVRETASGALDLSGSFATIGYGSIDYNLKTAIEEGRATLINHQRAIVSDGERFSFTVGEQIPITVIEVVGGYLTTLNTKDKVTGIKLIGVPKIFRGTNILMDMEIESSEISRFDTFDRGDKLRYTLPIITKCNVKTVVIVPSERPVYIGGLYTDNTSNITRKVPIIGDLPIIGFFLRGFNKSRKQTETIFRITPVIKLPGEGLDIGSSVFEELLQPEGGKSLIQQAGEKNTGAVSSEIPQAATDVASATGAEAVPAPAVPSATDAVSVPANLVPSATAPASATDTLDIPSPVIDSATQTAGSGQKKSTVIRKSNSFGNSSKFRLRR